GAAGRPAGGAAIAEARTYCAQVLATQGFLTEEQAFDYSDVAGSLATPVGGAVAALAGIGLYLGRRTPALAMASVVALVIAVFILRYVGGNGVLDFPARRRRGANLQARRGDDEPAVWLVAHLDSKWQPVSMFARVAGVIAMALGLIGLLILVLLRVHGYDGVAATLVLLTWLGAAPLILSIVGSRNDGTLDNATGVATILEAAESIPSGVRVGLLITDAEELGLAGVRAWMRGRPPVVALNCDSVDDIGRLTVMYSGRGAHELIARMRQVASALGEPLRTIPLIPGVLTDHVPLARAGWPTMTLSRGDFRTLGRVHTSRDTLRAMQGTGIASAARILARTATELG
ncbi:MAG TPA: M28 family peptidase, partial [Gemmatimonadaceae bacterium]